jgi:erythronate-4-phosphate dehydrogenase
MNILVDENIPYGPEAFGTLGTVRKAPGRSITNAMLADVDALIIRSITKVNAALLEGTPVRFVGTCTIGEDHVDKAHLAGQGIGFSSAPGCNANSVAEYVVTALLYLAQKYGFDLNSKRLGIVGVGNVGSKVRRKAEALGMTCVLNDPPLAAKTSDPVYRPLDELRECDVITFHTPLNKSGDYPSWHLADEAFLASLRPGTILFNTSRGAVVDNSALEAALRRGHITAAVLDVWEKEPTPDLDLLALTDIATPHIAGYSFDGKVNGTRQIYEALCAVLGIDAPWDPKPLLPPPPLPELTVDPDSPDVLTTAVLQAYDLPGDDARMRGITSASPDEQGVYFDRLRKEYPVRREFFNTRIRLTRPDNGLRDTLSGIGFNVVS